MARFRPETGSRQVKILPFGLIQNHVSCIVNDGGVLWMSGDRRNSYRTGVTIFDPDKFEFSYIETRSEIGFAPV